MDPGRRPEDTINMIQEGLLELIAPTRLEFSSVSLFIVSEFVRGKMPRVALIGSLDYGVSKIMRFVSY